MKALLPKDIHTHLPAPRPDAVISASPEEIESLVSRFPDQLWSVGYHPWELTHGGLSPEQLDALRRVAALPQVVAVGETGIDQIHEGAAPLFVQMNALKEHVTVSESVGKPLVLHAVRAQDILAPIRGQLNASQPWIIHGFRGKPSIARIYLNAGIALSYGELFNPESVAITPEDMLYTETDTSSKPIDEIIESICQARTANTPH